MAASWACLPDDITNYIATLADVSVLPTLSRTSVRNWEHCRERLGHLASLQRAVGMAPEDILGKRSCASVHLSDKEVSDSIGIILATALMHGALPQLETLVLCKGSLSDDGLSALARAFGTCPLHQLRTLSLEGNQIGDVGARALAGAMARGALPNLSQLDLEANQICDEGFEALASAVQSGMPRPRPFKAIRLGNNPGSIAPVLDAIRAIFRKRRAGIAA